MKRWYLLLFLLVPLAVFANVMQVFRYKQLEKEIQTLYAEQAELVESNKRLITGIAVLRSPRRLEIIAEEELGLEKLEPGELIRIFLKDREEGNDRP